MERLLERLLNYYNLSYEDYLKMTSPITEDNFNNDCKFENINEIVVFFKNAISENKKIIVYGDYDADGIMSTSIIVKMFQYVGYNVSYYVPNRIDGYGLNINKAKEIVNNGYDIVLTVDNGISAFEPIQYLKDNNISVVTFDHHELQDKYPQFDYFLHPTLSKYGDIPSSAAFVCFIFSISFLNRFDKYLATLASISLISDMMPLVGYNRNLLRLVIDNFKENEFMQIDLLRENDDFNSTTIGMKIAPKINSVGRLLEDESINQIVEFFVTNNQDYILNYINTINNLNDERKNIGKSSLDAYSDLDKNTSCFVLKTDEKEGIVGLISNFLLTKYKKPVIVFSRANEYNIMRGSCRAPEGYNILDIFNELSDIMVAFGGHALAGGCSINFDNFDNFKERFTDYINKHPKEIAQQKYVTFLISELTFISYDIIQSFGPFGEQMKEPLFVLPRIKAGALKFSKSGEHIMTFLGTNSKITGFNFSKELMSTFTYVDLIGTIRKSTYKGLTNIEFLVTEIKESKI